MVTIVTIPKLGISDEGELVSWETDIGERVEEGQVIALLESDKASAEISATSDGILLRTYVDRGEVIPIQPGRPIAAIGEEGETVPAVEEITGDDGTFDGSALNTTEKEPAATTEASDREIVANRTASGSNDVKATPKARRLAREHGVDVGAVDGTGPEGSVTTSDVKTSFGRSPSESESATPLTLQRDESAAPAPPADENVTPRARRAAGQFGVSLAQIDGTGPKGAVVEADVETYVEQLREQDQPPVEQAEPASTPDALATTGETPGQLTVIDRTTLSGTRRTIAERLSRSAREKPHVMGTRDVSIEQLQQVQQRLERELDTEVSLTDLVFAAVVRTLEDFPQFNAHFVDGEHRLIEEINVGYAVDSPKGLVVPVVTEATDRSLTDLIRERRTLVERTLEDRHDAADLQGGTFTVTNVGAFGMDVSYSIINPPQVAILAIGQRKPTAFERGGDVQFEQAITFSLSIDHRVLDGADSGRFLQRLADYIEYPGFALEALDDA